MTLKPHRCYRAGGCSAPTCCAARVAAASIMLSTGSCRPPGLGWMNEKYVRKAEAALPVACQG
jgi:hypothetical protein